MKFQQRHAFKAVNELRTVTAAENSLYLTHPAASKLIAAMEHRVGLQLFERIKGRLIPTAQGKVFYFEVVKAFNTLAATKYSDMSDANVMGYPTLRRIEYLSQTLIILLVERRGDSDLLPVQLALPLHHLRHL